MHKCQKCGNCCRQITMSMGLPPELAEFMSAHYGRTASVVSVRLDHKCVHLKDNNLCDIYETRPQYCRKFECPDPTEVIVLARDVHVG